MRQTLIYSITYVSTYFGRLYAHRQESRLRFTAYGFQYWLLLVVVLESRVVSCVHCGEDAARLSCYVATAMILLCKRMCHTFVPKQHINGQFEDKIWSTIMLSCLISRVQCVDKILVVMSNITCSMCGQNCCCHV
jgi:hypothetical protein